MSQWQFYIEGQPGQETSCIALILTLRGKELLGERGERGEGGVGWGGAEFLGETLPGSSTNCIPPTKYASSGARQIISIFFYIRFTIHKLKEELSGWLECCLHPPQLRCVTSTTRSHVPGSNPGIQSLTSHENSLCNSEKLLRHFTIPDDGGTA